MIGIAVIHIEVSDRDKPKYKAHRDC